MSGAVEDGGDLVALAMNVGTQRHPAWWLNLEAHPDAVVQLAGQRPRRMHARIAREERERLWRRWAGIDLGLDALAGRRSIETPSWSSSPSCTTARRLDGSTARRLGDWRGDLHRGRVDAQPSGAGRRRFAD